MRMPRGAMRMSREDGSSDRWCAVPVLSVHTGPALGLLQKLAVNTIAHHECAEPAAAGR